MPTAAHVFVDETKTRGLLLTAAAVPPGDVQPARKLMRGFVLRGQRRIHFTSERDSRRKQILDTINEIAPMVTLYDAATRPRRRQREDCLAALVTDLAARGGAGRLTLETDDSILDLDRKALYRLVRENDCPDLHYEHERAHAEPLLAIPDAIAWCWQRGGWWKTRIEGFIEAVRIL